MLPLAATTVDLARVQFALTSIYHFLFVPLTLGLGPIVAIMQTRWYRTGDEAWLRLTKFFGTLFLINFAIGVATGLVQEFQFGMNWSVYSTFVGGYTLLVGAATVLLFAFHGATFLTLRTRGALRERSAALARRLALPAVVVVAGALGWTVAVAMNRNERSLLPVLAPAAVGAAAVVAAGLLAGAHRPGRAFAATAVAAAAIVATLLVGLYPRVIVSHPDFANSLTVSGAATAHYALSVITVVAALCTPVVLLYQGWAYHVFRGRVGGAPTV